MTVVQLAGCRSDSLLGYLKALGILRLVSTQADPGARGSWHDAVFVLDTHLTEEELAAFFVQTYAPTPVANPWNSGAGFDGKADTASETMRRVAETKGNRWASYRRALSHIRERYVETGLRAQYLDSPASGKAAFVRDLRTHCPEEMLPWLDAALVLGPDRIGFPYLLGSGGNDGRLDFSVNFAARALDVCGDKPLPESQRLLRDALDDTAEARMVTGAAIGQFSPRHAGGPNATSGFDADSLVNPWDYVLMIEGSMLFAGSVGRRLTSSAGRPVFPFAVRGVAGGYGSASDDEQTRGEMWLPVWDGKASLASVTDLLRKGRIDLPSEGDRTVVRDAAIASEAAAAVVTMGVPLGIRRLERIAFVQRNGLAFAAAAVGPVAVGEKYDRGIAVISRDLGAWVERFRGGQLGGGVQDALRVFDDRLFSFANVSEDDPLARARARQELLVAIADIDRALGRSRAGNAAAPRLGVEVLAALDDGSTEHRVAVAIASLGARRRETETREELRVATDDPVRTLRDILERRTREAAKDPNAGWLRASCTVSIEDASAFLVLDRAKRQRFWRLLRAYGLISLADASCVLGVREDAPPIPAAYAVLKLVFDNPAARDERIVRLLFTGSTSRALALAVQRARTIPELPRGPRDVSSVRLEDAQWVAAALIVPIVHSTWGYGKLLDAALSARATGAENHGDGVRRYLATLS